MKSVEATPITSLPPPVVPGWAVPRGPITSAVEAAYLAGAALNSLDNLVRSDPPWAGAWRHRLALKCAAAAIAQGGRSEGERQLRDAWNLRQPGAELGPAGSILSAWRRLAGRSPALDAPAIGTVVELLGLRWSNELAAMPEFLDELAPSGQPAPLIATAIVSEVQRIRPDAGLLGWWLADQALARRMRWSTSVPLLAMQASGAAFRNPGGRGRIRPGEEGFERAVCVALAQAAVEACRIAGDMAPRAARLVEVTPKLRAKGAGEVIRLLLDDDAVSGTLQTRHLTRWGARRLFDRLITFGAVRELSGRGSFRLYGL